MNDIICKYCQSENVIKYGKHKDVQYYYCKDYTVQGGDIITSCLIFKE